MSKLKPCPIDLMKIRALCYDGALRAYVEDEYIYLKDTVSEEIVWIGDAAQPANEPLTLEQLREMDGNPVWIYDVNCWAIVAVEKYGRYANIPFAVGHFHGVRFEWDILDRKLVCYRRKPEATNDQ